MHIRMSQVAATALLALGAVLFGQYTAVAAGPAQTLGAHSARTVVDMQDDLGWQ
ncbi:hypothetical protein ACH4C2_04550 [Streptomyces sp. NPDC018057]|uniref:hypothetical protein n=1 Tax=unclassified Streptomyces TaxID=2593676 RepID=UPI0037B29F27